ncbi:MAG: FAD-dependent oxidoreductase [Pseudomonadota bacterium]
MKIAIIGAGLAGLTLARRLSDAHDVLVLEKARGPGGRMSTRRADPWAFDHGAQYFTAETPRFQAFLESLAPREMIASWPPAITLKGNARISDKPKYVAQPGMNALCKWLAHKIDLRTQVEVAHLHKQQDGWFIETDQGAGLGPFDWVISTAPAQQTARLMPAEFSEMPALDAVRMSGCFALMLGFDAPIALPWQALKSDRGAVGWIAVNSQKPQRGAAFSVLIQSTNVWADAHLEDPRATIQDTLLQAASDLAGTDFAGASHQVLHRWRYASTPEPAGKPYLLDADLGLAACGDWCLGSKVEAAFSSASALADAFQSITEA